MKKLLAILIVFISITTASFAETVVFNTQTHKIHKPGCQHAIKCTKNCIKIEKEQAKNKGGRPCKVCGG